MKLRFSVKQLIVMTTLLALGLTWWFRYPANVAQKFVKLVQNNELRAAYEMTPPLADERDWALPFHEMPLDSTVRALTPTYADWLNRRRKIEVIFKESTLTRINEWHVLYETSGSQVLEVSRRAKLVGGFAVPVL